MRADQKVARFHAVNLPRARFFSDFYAIRRGISRRPHQKVGQKKKRQTSDRQTSDRQNLADLELGRARVLSSFDADTIRKSLQNMLQKVTSKIS